MPRYPLPNVDLIMVRMTQEEVMAHEMRVNPVAHSKSPSDAVEAELDLHDDIMSECKRRGFLVIHSRMDRPSTNQRGTPDFVILAPNRVWFIEAKSRKGKRTPAQIGFAMMAERLGHTCHEVRSLSQFLAILNSGDASQRRD